MDKPLKVLISAYACGPNLGSEPGMAWNWIIALSEFCEIVVITECDYKNEILIELNRLQSKYKPAFYFIDIGLKGRSLAKQQGKWSFYLYYRDWQRKAHSLALKLLKEQEFDIIHQLNMIGYREPGYLWKIKSKPIIWGPIGGYAQMNWSFIRYLEIKDIIQYTLRNTLNSFQMRFSLRVRKAIFNSTELISASIDSYRCIKKIYGKESILINETGAKYLPQNVKKNNESGELKILWVGRMLGLKALPIALEALASLPQDIKYNFKIIGSGNNFVKWQNKCRNMSIYKNCDFLGQISHQHVDELLKKSDILLFTSLQEGTPHVVLEALTSGVPVICHDINGQGTVITEDCGIKIPLINYQNSINSFKNAILTLYRDRALLNKLSEGAIKRSKELTWENNAEQLLKIYKNAIAKF